MSDRIDLAKCIEKAIETKPTCAYILTSVKNPFRFEMGGSHFVQVEGNQAGGMLRALTEELKEVFAELQSDSSEYGVHRLLDVSFTNFANPQNVYALDEREETEPEWF